MKSLIIFLCIVAIPVLVVIDVIGDIDKSVTSPTGKSERCVDGVVYINFTTGASPKYQKSEEPKLVLC
jgi:hypothetical protein